MGADNTPVITASASLRLPRQGQASNSVMDVSIRKLDALV